MALETLDVPHQHVFACDVAPSVEKFLKHTYDIGIFFSDMLKTEAVDLAPSVDLYVCGWPCQSHSSMGNQRGLDDPRSLVVGRLLDYLTKKIQRASCWKMCQRCSKGRRRQSST